MSWPAGAAHFGLSLRQGQLQTGLFRRAVPLLGGQLGSGGGLTPGIVLLRLNRLAFPTPRHLSSLR